jgi:membrane protease YdiL (CAAX protease family)
LKIQSIHGRIYSAMSHALLHLKSNRGQLLYAAVVIAVLYLLFNAQEWLVRFPAYRHLYRGHPFYLPEGIKTALQITLCLAVVALSLGKNFRTTFAELRLDRGFSQGLLFGLLATLPFLIGLAVTHSISRVAWPAIFYLAFFAPFSEELVVRAYGFGQLHRRCGWPVWLAILLTALIFGWGHIEKGNGFGEAAALFLLTGIGGALIAWFYYRWDSIWFPWTVHALMNFYWEIFSVSKTALGGWFPFALQWTTLLCATLLTKKATRKKSAAQVSA